MRVPSQVYEFCNGLRCVPRNVDLRAVQAHVIKHPFGMAALLCTTLRGGRRWNAEGWDATVPQVLALEERRAATRSIRQLVVGSERCAVERLESEAYAGTPPENPEACYQCPEALATACGPVIDFVAKRYAAWSDEILGRIAGQNAIAVDRAALCAEITRRAVVGGGRLDGMVVMSVGRRPSADAMARVCSWNGIRTDFYLHQDLAIRWRTTFREPPSGPYQQASFLLGLLPVARGLSETCLVPRLAWGMES